MLDWIEIGGKGSQVSLDRESSRISTTFMEWMKMESGVGCVTCGICVELVQRESAWKLEKESFL